ncbi:hypothetical protein QBC39DRAFT_155847 [Podospora conica]|nr:hypothetical protein QBC39DRAFT_155847 [Schizothecium conicum]
MGTALNIQAQEQLLGRWPRRLLHVPSMTSFEWQPGNRYGPTAEPAYNAITYTWGRWKLKGGEQPDVFPLPIYGVAWEIPRVDPSCFTTHQLRAAILTATSKVKALGVPGETTPVDFVWLDIACIDQRWGEPTSAAELGRQAVIFKHAQNVFTWLHTLDRPAFASVMAAIVESASAAVSAVDPRSPDPPAARAALRLLDDCTRRFFADPWFSSLWTLQEAFLRPDAVVMTSDACVPPRPDAPAYHVSMWDVIAELEQIQLSAALRETAPGIYDRLLSRFQKTGWASLFTGHPLATYLAASNRTAKRAEDRVYGIQQIFGFRVGISAVDAVPGSHFSLAQLEDQLGEQLLARLPIISQYHVFTEPVVLGRGWLVSSSKSVLPDLDGHDVAPTAPVSRPAAAVSGPDEEDLGQEELAMCTLSVRRVGGLSWGHFAGRACDFHVLAERSRQFETSYPFSDELFEEMPFFRVHLDATEELGEYKGPNPNASGPERHRPTVDKLLKRFDGQARKDLKVLLLGRMSTDRAAAMVGLVVLRRFGQGVGHFYHRLGLCTWLIAYTEIGGEPLDTSVFNGDGEHWKSCSGLFG